MHTDLTTPRRHRPRGAVLLIVMVGALVAGTLLTASSAMAALIQCQSNFTASSSVDMPDWRVTEGGGSYRDGSFRTSVCNDGAMSYQARGTRFEDGACVTFNYDIQRADGSWAHSGMFGACGRVTVRMTSFATLNARVYFHCRAVDQVRRDHNEWCIGSWDL